MGEQAGGQSHSALRIVAACQSTAEFVAAYSRYCEGKSLFIATKSPKATGHIVKFKIALASGEHLITGVGPVVETFDDRENRFNRPGMRVEVEKLDASGRHWMEQLRTRSGAAPGAPAVVSSPTGMFSTVTDDSMAVAPVAAASTASAPAVSPAPEAPVAAVPVAEVPVAAVPVAVVPVAPVAAVAPPALPVAVVAPPALPVAVVAPPVLPRVDKPAPSPVPVPIPDNLSAGWELDGLPDPLSLPRPRSVTAPLVARSENNGEKVADKNGARPSEKTGARNGERPGERNGEKPQAVVASGELEVPPQPPPLPPPPTKGRSKRITFPALMFNKPRGIAVPAPSGAVVPKPLALLPAAGRESKLRPATAPIEREPAAPVAPLGTPSDTEPHAMVPPEIESSLARSQAPAEGTPPPAAEPSAAADNYPDITEAPPEASQPIAMPEAAPPSHTGKRTKASTTTPPPVWTERTVTQTLHALVGGRPDPRVQEETVHWTNPGFAALTRPPTVPEVDIIEDEVSSPIDSLAVPLVVGVEITSDVMDKTVVTPPPVPSRARLVIAMVGVAAACLAGGYYLGMRQGLSIDKLPVGGVASAEAAPAAEKEAWIVECAPPADDTAASVAAEPAAGEEPERARPAPERARPESAEVESLDSSRASAPAPPLAAVQPAAPTSPSSCYLNAMTSPVGAIVLIDNKSGGRTPLRTKVSCGRHTVRFEMDNYQPATRSVTVSRGETEKVSAELARPRAVLRVESTPSGATVLINGSSVGLTPLTTTVPGFVTSNVTLSKPGYKPVVRQINPTSSASARIGATLKADASTARRSSSSRR